ncbi:RecX family transcriptional regulator [Candidatus Daviesbacteria bacterium]|nr:RecX family transcriptional regulator [Candidatus Daviesbacteria bacterium]
MAEITSIEPQKKGNRYNIFLDGKFAFGADEDLVVNYRLVVGKKIDPQDLDKLLLEAQVGKLMERMYGLFSFRARSEKEIRDYLKRKNFQAKIKDGEEISDLVTEFLMSRLKQKGLINDLEFAKSWVDARRKSKQKGIRALKAELWQKGINREIIDQVVQAGGEEELAQIALAKKVKQWEGLPRLEFKKKAIEFLMRRGFSYNVASDVVEKSPKKG